MEPFLYWTKMTELVSDWHKYKYLKTFSPKQPFSVESHQRRLRLGMNSLEGKFGIATIVKWLFGHMLKRIIKAPVKQLEETLDTRNL